MAAEKIQVKIESDYDDRGAQQALDDVEALERAEPEIEITADASAVERFAQKMVESAAEIESRTAATRGAIDALGAALGDAADRFDVGAIVAEMQKVGISADDIKADADAAATKLREINNVELGGVNNELDTLDRNVDDVRDTSDQTRSVLANMAGNTAGELGELGGVAGTVGQAIGQLAEYATEGNISLSELGKLAGPIAGLAALSFGIQAVSGAMESVNRKTEEWDKFQKDLADAAKESGSAVEALREQLELGTEIEPPDLSTFETLVVKGKDALGGLVDVLTLYDGAANSSADETLSLERAMAAAGITQEDFLEAITESGSAMINMRRALSDMVVAGTISEGEYELLIEQLEAYRTQLRATDADLQVHQAVTRNSLHGINDAMEAYRDSLSLTKTLWAAVVNDLADGRLDTDNARQAWNQLRRELNLSEEAMAELADQKLDEQLRADADAARAAGDAWDEAGAKAWETSRALGDARRIMEGADWGKATLDAAGEAWSQFIDQQYRHSQNVDAVFDAYDALGPAIEAAADEGLSFDEMMTDFESSTARDVQSALRDISDSYLPAIQNAFVNADGDVGVFKANMDDLAERTMTRLQEQFNLSEEDARTLTEQILATPEEYQTVYDLAGDAEAVAKLDLLQGVIDDLPRDVQTDVTLAVIQDDPQAALDAIERYARTHRPVAPVNTALGSDRQFRNDLAAQTYSTTVDLRAGRRIGFDPIPVPDTLASTVNVTMNLPHGMRANDAIAAVQRFQRRNGAGF